MTASTAAATVPPLFSTEDNESRARATWDRSTSACVSERRGARAGTRWYASLVRDEVRFRLWQLALDGGDAVRAGGQLHAELGAQPQCRSDHLHRLGLGGADSGEYPCLAELHQLQARQPLRPVMCERVRGLVAEHHREARLVLRQRQDAAVHGDLPAGQAPGIHGLGVVDQRDLRLVPRVEACLGGVRDPFRHTLDHRIGYLVAARLSLGELLRIRLLAKLVHRSVADEIELFTARNRRGGASDRNHEEGERSSGQRALHATKVVTNRAGEGDVPSASLCSTKARRRWYRSPAHSTGSRCPPRKERRRS